MRTDPYTGGRLDLVWTMRCSCGHTREFQVTLAPASYAYGKSEAQRARREHLEAVAPRPDERCRAPKDHRCRWWDDCGLCAGQMVLPGL
ncbi:hypothetical protein [Nocardiopsis halophila]|uniref:hypothetical protein n=1 Tax=Nocardiopsis halophila TaxID=141692 RepID=UPI0019D32A3E|nr:hypothetical protein [Nocardiopsis halophila]